MTTREFPWGQLARGAGGADRERKPARQDGALPLDQIELPADNPRRELGDVAELARSIAAVGLLEPLVVTPRDGRYLLVCGARRHAAARQLGLDEVPVVVRELDERERREAMLIENLQREDLHVLEEAAAYQGLVELGLSQRKIAERVGRSQSHVSKRVALLELPAEVRGDLDSGRITLEDAQELLKLREMPKRLQAAWTRGRNSATVSVRVEEELREHDQVKRLGEETQRLKNAGVRVLKSKRDAYRVLKLPKGAVEVSKQGGWSQLKLDPEKHAKEPCAAAIVSDSYGGVRVIHLCTDRKRHPKLKTGAERDRTREVAAGARAKELEQQKQLKAAAKARREFARDLLERRVTKDTALERLVQGFLTVSQQDALKLACELLGLEPRQTKSAYGATYRDFTTPIEAFAVEGPAQLQRAALALALGAVEVRMATPWRSEWDARERAHLDYLQAQGYELSEAERSRLGRKRK